MNISFTLRCLVCCVTLAASISLAQADVVSHGDKKAPQSIATVITTSDNPATTPLDQVPEPSTGSLILIGLGSVGLAMKLRKQA
jgi:PEP-CTERM motif-containing protein